MNNTYWTRNKIEEWLTTHNTKCDLIDLKYEKNSVLLCLIKFPDIKYPKWIRWSTFRNKNNFYTHTNACIPLDIQFFQQEINNVLNGYKVISCMRDKNSKIKLFVQCNNNHEPYWVYRQHLLDKHICKKCVIYKTRNYPVMRKPALRTKKFLLNYYKEKCKLCDLILIDICRKDNFIKLIIQDKDGYKYEIHTNNLRNVINKNSKLTKYNSNPFAIYNLKLWCKLNRPDYDFIDSTFRGYKEKHLFIYNGEHINKDCNRKFMCRISDFMESNVRHPKFNMSKFENKVYDYLINNDILFEREKTFNDLVGLKNRHYRFDFYLPQYNAILELNGIQHYNVFPNSIYNEKSVYEIQKRDAIKKEYCKKNNIKYISIPYWYFRNDKYKNILKEELRLS